MAVDLNTIVPPQDLPPQIQVSNQDVAVTGMRVHELAIQRWFNRRFFVAEGTPVPVLFAKPMDAFADFQTLWKQHDGALGYLLAAVDKDGKPLYQPFPQPVRLPMISVNRTGWSFSAKRTYSPHWNRHVGWPTVSPNAQKVDLANVYQAEMPTAWDFKYQVDHFSSRPDTQALFIQTFMRTLSKLAASQAQTWINVLYPGYFGTQPVRVYLPDDSVQDLTEDDPENFRVYRTSLTLTVEGWSPDPNNIVVPAFWSQVSAARAVDPASLESQYANAAQQSEDLRLRQANAVFNSVNGLPLT